MTRYRKRFVWCWLAIFFLFSPGIFSGDSPDEQFLILLTNDDGYEAPGLRALAEALAPLGEVVVAAPVENQSGTGHGTTSRQFISARPIELVPGVRGYALAARPATCTRLVVEALLPRRPDLVLSGINRGLNLGVVTYYSGTVGAAREAAFLGIPAIAVSMQGDDAADYAATAAFVRRLVEELRKQGRLRPGLFLNVNAPAGGWRSVELTRQSATATPQIFTRYTNPRGELYFWSDYRALPDDVEGTDVWAVAHGSIALTPLQIDQTQAAALDWLRQLQLEAAPATAGR